MIGTRMAPPASWSMLPPCTLSDASPRLVGTVRSGRSVLLTSRCRWAGSGYADQDSALWSEGGTLLARCQQALAFFQRG